MRPPMHALNDVQTEYMLHFTYSDLDAYSNPPVLQFACLEHVRMHFEKHPMCFPLIPLQLFPQARSPQLRFHQPTVLPNLLPPQPTHSSDGGVHR